MNFMDQILSRTVQTNNPIYLFSAKLLTFFKPVQILCDLFLNFQLYMVFFSALSVPVTFAVFRFLSSKICLIYTSAFSLKTRRFLLQKKITAI